MGPRITNVITLYRRFRGAKGLRPACLLKMAAKLMQSLTEDLVKVFSANDPLTIADGLFSKKLLTKEVYSRLRLEHRTDKDRSRDIVFHLNYQVDANPSDIYLIIEELLAKDLLSDRIQQILSKQIRCTHSYVFDTMLDGLRLFQCHNLEISVLMIHKDQAAYILLTLLSFRGSGQTGYKGLSLLCQENCHVQY